MPPCIYSVRKSKSVILLLLTKLSTCVPNFGDPSMGHSDTLTFSEYPFKVQQ